MGRKVSFAPALAAAVALAAAATPAPVLAQSARGSAPPECTERTLPRAERVAMEREFARRFDADGKASAEAWLRNEAEAAFGRLVDQGICIMDGSAAREAAPRPAPSRQVARGKDGQPCKRTRLVNRPTAGFGGAPMTMALVPVCAD
jgi:hypothetical protein